jgi:hypothetical protein
MIKILWKKNEVTPAPIAGIMIKLKYNPRPPPCYAVRSINVPNRAPQTVDIQIIPTFSYFAKKYAGITPINMIIGVAKKLNHSLTPSMNKEKNGMIIMYTPKL